MSKAFARLCTVLMLVFVLASVSHARDYFMMIGPTIHVECDPARGMWPDAYEPLDWNGSVTFTYTVWDEDRAVPQNPIGAPVPTDDRVRAFSKSYSPSGWDAYCSFSVEPFFEYDDELTTELTVQANNQTGLSKYAECQLGWNDEGVYPDDPPGNYSGACDDAIVYVTKRFLIAP